MTMIHIKPANVTAVSRFRHKSGPPLVHTETTMSDLNRTQSLTMLHNNHTECAQPSRTRRRSKSESCEDVQLDPDVSALWSGTMHVGATSAET